MMSQYLLLISGFARALDDIPSSYRPNDAACLVVYLAAFEEEESYLLRDKDPKNLHQAYRIAMDIENNLKYGIPKGYLSARVCYPKMLGFEAKHESETKEPCQDLYIPTDHISLVTCYDLNKNMSEENLSQIVVILHIDKKEVNEKVSDILYVEMDVVSITLLNDNNNDFSRKNTSQEDGLLSCVSDRSDSECEELESFMSEMDVSLQDCDDMNSDDKIPLILVNKIMGIERCMMCTTEEDVLIQAISSIKD